MYDRKKLISLIRSDALQTGDFTLASGKKSSYYLDCRRVTLDSSGAVLVAEGILELLGEDLPDAVGGLAIGADPITAALITTVGLRGVTLKGFIVRKEPKGHGRGRDVEGPVEAGQSAIIVEDVVTTGGSALQAAERAEQRGLKVLGVVGVIDRLQGGAEALAQRGYWLKTLFTIRDFGLDP